MPGLDEEGTLKSKGQPVKAMQNEDRIRKATYSQFCPHARGEVRIHSVIVYPADIIPETPPRITQRSCNQYLVCNLLDKTFCPMAVTQFVET